LDWENWVGGTSLGFSGLPVGGFLILKKLVKGGIEGRTWPGRKVKGPQGTLQQSFLQKVPKGWGT